MVTLARLYLPGPLWKSLIALFGMLHLVYWMNSHWSSRASSDTVFFTFTCHTWHFIIFTIFIITTFIFSYSFSLSFGTLRLRSSANPFLHRPFFSYRTDSTDSRTIKCFYPAQRLDLFAWCVRLSRLLVGFRTHLKSTHFYFIASSVPNDICCSHDDHTTDYPVNYTYSAVFFETSAASVFFQLQ